MTTPHKIDTEYDLVFAGGGTTAIITATRLAAAFPALKILVLESGPTTEGRAEHTIPGNYVTHLAPDSKTMQSYTSEATPDLLGRALPVASARCIGGGSSLNFMLYNRPAPSDFDNWETEFGNVGWSSKDLVPLLKKAETYQLETSNDTHGTDGPLRVSLGGHIFDVGKQLLEIGPHFELDRPRGYGGSEFAQSDVNQFFQMPKWISKDGVRSDVAHHYLYGKNLRNLSVCDGCRVSRVVVEEGTATAVEYLFDKRVYPAAAQNLTVVKARKLVVVSAGTMGSSLILERSGIGSKEILGEAGVSVVENLPGVGENYQDHAAVFTPYFADPNVKTMDPLFRREPEAMAVALEEYHKQRTGLMATTGVDGVIKMRPHPDELADLGPEFKPYWDEMFAPNPDKPLFWFSATGGFVILGYPASRGHLHISSADPYAEPNFQGGYLSHPADVAALRWGYKKGRELMRRLPVYRGPLAAAHPQFPQSSAAAAWDSETSPVALDAPKFTYTAEDDAAIDLHTRAFMSTVWHSLGTCAMKPREQGGVVDSNLNVYGVKNLKVADLSIPPANVNSNTYSTAVAIGEKAAMIIAGELGGEL
ncbi:hypothetical protein MKEN_01320600 [Mycena kentingensis (nom. inval.)]|nr:hypothetical protein MKEN_01320600 [Mycena kentingensis (nom. inval.)]